MSKNPKNYINMQSIENLTIDEKAKKLSKLRRKKSVDIKYGGLDLPKGNVPPVIIKGKILDVGIEKFKFGFEDGEQASLSISDVLAIWWGVFHLKGRLPAGLFLQIIHTKFLVQKCLCLSKYILID